MPHVDWWFIVDMISGAMGEWLIGLMYAFTGIAAVMTALEARGKYDAIAVGLFLAIAIIAMVKAATALAHRWWIDRET